METKLMRTFPFASLLSATTLAVSLGACQTASNAPNGLLTAASPLKTDLKNETLDNLVLPETFKTASASHVYIRDISQDTIYIGNNPPRTVKVEYERYGGDQPIGISSNVLVTRNPRDATFNIVIAGQDGITANNRYQDPAHRTTAASINFQSGQGSPTSLFKVPDRASLEYYQSGSRQVSSTTTVINDQVWFFERPGTSNKYVTWAAYWDGTTTESIQPSDYVSVAPDGSIKEAGTRTVATFNSRLQRTAAVYGINTISKDVPKIGSAVYTGNLFANTISGGFLDTILGTSSSSVNFVNDSMAFTLAGNFTSNGNSFAATGIGKIDRPDTPNTALNPTALQPLSSFRGTISTVSIAGNPLRFDSNTTALGTFQASSVEGGFFGPGAAELGGAFRIVGGAPDARLDILGAFIGKKN
jgi:hypothetical protein